MPTTLYRRISVCLDIDTYLRISMERSYVHQATCAVSDYGCHGLNLSPPGRPSSLTCIDPIMVMALGEPSLSPGHPVSAELRICHLHVYIFFKFY